METHTLVSVNRQRIKYHSHERKSTGFFDFPAANLWRKFMAENPQAKTAAAYWVCCFS